MSNERVLALMLAFLLAVAYAALIAWLNTHRRWGAFWSAHSWLEVVAGDLLIALTAWAIAGMETFLLVLGLDALWGAPMVIGSLIVNMRRMERENEQAQADRITR